MAPPSSLQPQFVLTIASPDRPGIVAAVTTFLFEAGGNILEAQQFDDQQSNRFFMRVVFTSDRADEGFTEGFREAFKPIAERFGMNWALRDRLERRRVMILMSKFDHCMVDLLSLAEWRAADGDYRHRRQSPARDLCRRRFLRPPLSSPANHPPDEDGAGGRALGSGAGDQDRSRRPRALYAGPVGRADG
jgi:predicted amino acid-binding ACT domain protein